jgi:hypothetical protein
VRETVIKPTAIRQILEFLNEDIRMWSDRRGPDVRRARAQVQNVVRQEANLRRTSRSAGPKAMERINLEIEAVGTELADATARLRDIGREERPVRITTKPVQEAMDGIARMRVPIPSRTPCERVKGFA